jgi:hypothetical protein
MSNKTSFRDNIKRAMGFPLLDVELDEKDDIKDNNIKDDYDWIEEQVLRKIRTYFPCEYIISRPVPGTQGENQVSIGGNGFIDLSNEDILTVKEVYVTRPKVASGDVLLPWSLVRIWEKIWVGASEFVGTDLLLYKNELSMLAKASDNVFWWKWYEAERKLYICNTPSWAGSIGIMCLKGVDRIDHIDERSIEYGLALKLAIGWAKVKIGQTFRKYEVDGMRMPGQNYTDEGKTEISEAEEKIEEMRYYPGGLS